MRVGVAVSVIVGVGVPVSVGIGVAEAVVVTVAVEVEVFVGVIVFSAVPGSNGWIEEMGVKMKSGPDVAVAVAVRF